jgi:diguanylate cyclase (GGDEF)-like protein/PAS domain S-box-containing protein
VTNDLFELEINKWKSAYNDIGEPAFMIDKDGEIVCANLIAKSIFSHSEKTLKDLVAYIDENESDDNPVAFQVNDAVSWYSVKKNNFNNKRKFINYLFINITERKKAEEALQDSENRLLEAQRMANIGSWELNLENKTIWGSREAFSIYGIPYTDETLPLDILQKSVALEYRPMMDARLTGLIERNEHYDVEYKIKKVDTGMECFVHSRAMLAANKKGNLTRVVGTIQDITERKRKEEDILYLSYHDQLTGLYNRRFYEEELKRLDTERNLPLTIAMGDVNGLKLINDSFGHDIGDELLKKVAEVIKGACRADDIIARLGGDEFVVIFPRTDAPESEKIIQRIKDLASIEKVSSLDISISFGFGTKHKKEESIQALIKNTEDQMYRHKLYQGSSMKSKTIDLVIGTLYEKNHREMLHSNRVSKLCETIAMAMKLDTDEVNQIKIAGLMHDIGKIGIDEKILNKPGRLSKEEFKEIKRHSEIGYRILSSVNEFSEIADYVLEHQERWDGTGYPRGIKGENISLQARIIAVADAYDAMITKRSYQPEMTEKEAAEEIRRCSGSQFDPYVAEIFIEQVLNNPEKK